MREERPPETDYSPVGYIPKAFCAWAYWRRLKSFGYQPIRQVDRRLREGRPTRFLCMDKDGKNWVCAVWKVGTEWHFFKEAYHDAD